MISFPNPFFDSYIDLEYADEFHRVRNNSVWIDALEDERAPALVRATDFISTNYTFTVDPLANDEVHPDLAKAVASLAIYALSEGLDQKPERLVEEEEVASGSDRVRTRYAKSTSGDPYPFVTKMLARIANSSSSGVVIGRLVK